MDFSNVKKIITHKYCADGTSSAMILRDVLHNASVEFVSHGKDFESLRAEPGLLFCDVSPPRERIQEFLDQGSLVFDHHESVKDITLAFEKIGLGAYGDIKDGWSGANLAYQKVWLPLKAQAKTDHISVERFAKLAAVYDTFATSSLDWEDAILQQEALRFYPIDYWLNNHACTIYKNESDIGKICHDTYLRSVDRAVNNIYTFSDSGKSVAVFQGKAMINHVAENLRKNGVNVVFAFSYSCENNKISLSISCRSDHSFDCSKFASIFKGGGHIPSAGFIMEVEKFSQNPFADIEHIFRRHGKSCILA